MVNPIHLHVHTDGSLLDGICNIDLLLDEVENQGTSSVAITDHGNMIKVFEFYQKAIKRNIKPILGCEFYIVGEDSKKTHHIILLAKNKTGFSNLLKLRYISNDNFYYKPRIKFSDLQENASGLICLSACIGNEIFANLDSPKSIQILLNYKELFGDDYYLEIQSNTLDEQKRMNTFIRSNSLNLGINCVVTCDAHYVRKEHYTTHDTALCIGTNSKKNNSNRFRFPSNEFYLQSSEDIKRNLSYLDLTFVENAILNTHSIANKVNFDFDFSTTHAPKFTDLEDEKILLAKKCNEGFANRVNQGKIEDKQVAINRIKYELNIICNSGYSGYFLIVQDFINHCKERDIPTGVGRGSVCGSMVAYILGIHEVNPIKYNLLFERFLNPSRLSYPDIDTDFCYERRDEVIEYIENKYGRKNVCGIMAEGKLTLKAVSRRVLTAYGYETKIINIVNKHMDNYKTVNQAIQDVEISSRVGASEIKDMLLLENNMSHASTHAAGIVIAPEPIVGFLPLSKDRESGKYVSEWHKKHIEKLNLIKFDILGLKQLTVFSKCLSHIADNSFKIHNLYDIDLEDECIYNVLCDSSLLQVIFQFSGDSASAIVKSINPTSFEDIMVGESICRPGVKEAQLYIKNKKSFDATGDYEKPVYWEYVKEILGPTYGAIVYQEQTMLIMNKITGGAWDLGKCDSMRKVSDLSEFRDDFVSNSITTPEIAGEIFDRFSLEYSFNKSHACAYGVLSACCAYLLYHYPKEYLSACMTVELTQTNPNLKGLINIAKKLDIEMLPPDINNSGYEFIPCADGIRMPLNCIAFIGDNISLTVIKNRPYSSVEDFLKKVPGKTVNKRCVSMLIKAGVFDFYNENRTFLLNEYYKSRNENVPVLYWCDDTQICFENEAYGFSLGKHPLDKYINHNISEIPDGDISIVCIINEISNHRDKNGNDMCFLRLENKVCTFEGVCFSDTFKKYKDKLVQFLPLLISGKKSGNSVIINKIIRA